MRPFILILCAICIFMHFYADEFGYSPVSATNTYGSMNLDNREVIDHSNDNYIQYTILDCPNTSRTISTKFTALLVFTGNTVAPIFSPPRI